MSKEKSDRKVSTRFDFEPGTILNLHCDGENLNKDKYFLVLSSSTSGAVALFIINSTINRFLSERPLLKVSQFQIKKSDYNFLKHDSYINCCDIKWWFSKNKISVQIKKNKNRIKGSLDHKHLKSIIEIVHHSPTLPPIEKEEISNSLNKIIK